MDQSVKLKLEQAETRRLKTGGGVRQGCCLSPIPINLYSEYLNKEAHESFGDFIIGGQVIRTLKYAVDLVLLAKKEEEKTKVIGMSRQPSPLQIMI
jgi:hypothetical protein